jgi:preprotein translocase subunit SecB
MEATTHPVMSPLRLDRYFLKKLYFGLHEDFDRARIADDDLLKAPHLQVDVVSAHQNPDNPFQWRFELNIELLESEAGDFPYKVETTVVGYFTVSEQLLPDRAERLARVNGPAVLYSSAREIIASVTGRSNYKALLLPTVTFIQPERAQAAGEVKALLPPAKTRARKTTTKRTSKKGTTKKKAR